MSSNASRQGGSWGAAPLCWCAHRPSASASSPSLCHPSCRACGASQSPSRAACQREGPHNLPPAVWRMTSGARPVPWRAHTTSWCMARPRKCHVSSTRPAPSKGDESTAAGRWCHPHFPRALASAPGRDTSVRSRSAMIRRARNATRAPGENGAVAAPSVPQTHGQRLSRLAVTPASASPT